MCNLIEYIEKNKIKEIELFNVVYDCDDPPPDFQPDVYGVDMCSYRMPSKYPVEKIVNAPDIRWGDCCAGDLLTVVVKDMTVCPALIWTLLYLTCEMEVAKSYVQIFPPTFDRVVCIPLFRLWPLVVPGISPRGPSSTLEIDFSYEGVWRRRIVYKNDKTLPYTPRNEYVSYAPSDDGVIYASVVLPSLLVFVPHGFSPTLHLLSFSWFILKNTGVLCPHDGPAVSNSKLFSYEICHSPLSTGVCNGIDTFRKFCRITQKSMDDPIFKDSAAISESVYFSPHKLSKRYMDKNILYGRVGHYDDECSVFWKYFCSVCAFPHSRFGHTLDGANFLCGTDDEFTQWRCVRQEHCCGGCVKDYAALRRKRLQTNISYFHGITSDYYNESDAICPELNIVFKPSFGVNIVGYLSKSVFSNIASRCETTRMCTCVLSYGFCDTNECVRDALVSEDIALIGRRVFLQDNKILSFPLGYDTNKLLMRDLHCKTVVGERSRAMVLGLQTLLFNPYNIDVRQFKGVMTHVAGVSLLGD